MGRSYRQLSLEDRCEIARLSANGSSVRQIAAALDRPPSTISRELKRNRAQAGYQPGYANQRSRARRWKGSRLERDERLQCDLLREHLPLHLCPDCPHQGLSLAKVPAARQEQARLSRQEGRRLCQLHRRPCFLG